MEGSKKSIILFIFFLLAGGIFFIYRGLQPVQEKYEQPSPVEAVTLYFTSWSSNNYADMYSTISDGFKKIEPTAKDLKSFESRFASQESVSLSLLDAHELSNDGKTAVVAYSLNLTYDDGIFLIEDGELTLKNRQDDIIRGWKLIQPYGERVDTS